MSFVRKRLRPRLLAVYALGIALLVYARPSPPTLALGALPIAAGEALRLWATFHLHKNDALTVTGPYAYLRNPLYLGTLLIALGFAIAAASLPGWIVLGVFVVGYFVYYMPYKNRIEGARLEALYGDAYRRYASAVPSLFPRLHPYVPLGAEAPREPDYVARFRDNNEIGTAAAVLAGVLALCVRWVMV